MNILTKEEYKLKKEEFEKMKLENTNRRCKSLRETFVTEFNNKSIENPDKVSILTWTSAKDCGDLSTEILMSNNKDWTRINGIFDGGTYVNFTKN